MYFVTINRPGYILFCATPSERAAIGLTDKQVVHFLVRDAGGAWTVQRRWNASDYSHTEFLSAWHRADEPDNPAALLEILPGDLPDAPD
jgi:hypothetical protein